MAKLFSMPRDEWGDAFRTAEGSHPLGYPAYIIEKDFWVTQILLAIYNHFAPSLSEKSKFPFIFKGGTSLSKCYGIINRMSEDIDLSIALDLLGCQRVLKKEGDSRASRRRDAEAIDEVAKIFVKEEFFPKINELLTAMDERIVVKIEGHAPLDISIIYPQSLDEDDYGGAVQSRVLLETGGLSLNNPVEIKNINHMLGECIESLKDEEVNIAVLALHPQRTMLEKIFGIHVNLTQNRGRPKYARHLYDIVMLHSVDKDWCRDKDLFLDGVDFSDVHYKTHEVSCNTAGTGPIILVPVDEDMFDYYKNDWIGMADMFPGGSLPFTFEELIERTKTIESVINDVYFDLKTN